MDFVEGQNVILHVKGAGETSKEPATIDYIEAGVIYAGGREFDLDGRWLDTDDMFGFDFWIEPK